jgi:hypothetical protein
VTQTGPSGGWLCAGMTWHAVGVTGLLPCKKAPSPAGGPGGSRIQSQREDALGEHSGAYASVASASSPKLNAAADCSGLAFLSLRLTNKNSPAEGIDEGVPAIQDFTDLGGRLMPMDVGAQFR